MLTFIRYTSLMIFDNQLKSEDTEVYVVNENMLNQKY